MKQTGMKAVLLFSQYCYFHSIAVFTVLHIIHTTVI